MTVSRVYWSAYLGDWTVHYRAGPEAKIINKLCDQDPFFEKNTGYPTVVLFALNEIEHCPSASRSEKGDDRLVFDMLEDLLVRWTPSSTADSALTNVSEAFRYAALVHYARKARKLSHRHATVQQYVVQCLKHIDQIDYSKTSVNVI